MPICRQQNLCGCVALSKSASKSKKVRIFFRTFLPWNNLHKCLAIFALRKLCCVRRTKIKNLKAIHNSVPA